MTGPPDALVRIVRLRSQARERQSRWVPLRQLLLGDGGKCNEGRQLLRCAVVELSRQPRPFQLLFPGDANVRALQLLHFLLEPLKQKSIVQSHRCLAHKGRQELQVLATKGIVRQLCLETENSLHAATGDKWNDKPGMQSVK